MTIPLFIFPKFRVLAARVTLLTSFAVQAQSTGRQVVDPNDPRYKTFTRLVGEVTQIKNPQGAGNGFIIGRNGCHIITNFHVAFGKSKDPKTKQIEIIEPAEVGHQVSFTFDFDTKTEKFKRTMKATVVEFGNYEADTTTGLVEDLAILRLENCLGKGYAGMELDRPDAKKFLPTGRLMTVSTSRKVTDLRLNEMLVEEGCRSESVTVIAGAIFLNCHSESGMSGSMVLEQDVDQKWRLVGMSTATKTLKDGSERAVAIYSRRLTPFIESVIGEESMANSPGAAEHKQQSHDHTSR